MLQTQILEWAQEFAVTIRSDGRNLAIVLKENLYYCDTRTLTKNTLVADKPTTRVEKRRTKAEGKSYPRKRSKPKDLAQVDMGHNLLVCSTPFTISHCSMWIQHPQSYDS